MTGQQLKNSILQMAVQGKLVPQDPNDEPAAVLLERIRAEKERLVKEGKIKKEKNPSVIFRGADNLPYEKVGDKEPVCIADEVPFEIPESWEWVRLFSLGEIVGGGTPKTSDSKNWTDATIPWLTPADMKYVTGKYVSHGERAISEYGLAHSSTQLMPAGSILYSSRAPIGYIAISENSVCTNQGFKSLVPIIHDLNDYLYYCLIALTPSIQARASGTTFKEISGTEFGKTLIPVPPLIEQKRIVTKIEEVLPGVNQYNECANTLTKLNHDFPDSLKKSILQWAVQGNLVPQDPNDEPASVLLERIRAEKEQLIREGKIKRDKHESVIFRRDNSYYEVSGKTETCIDNEIPFDIPDGWMWSRLSFVASKIVDGEHKTPLRIEEYCGYYLLSARNVRDGELSLADVDYVDENEFQRIANRCNPKIGDILISCSGSIGRCCVIRDTNNYVMVRSAAMVSLIEVNSEYLMLAVQSDCVQQQIRRRTKQAVQANLFQDAIRNLLIPIPPLVEQFRIVEKYYKVNSLLTCL